MNSNILELYFGFDDGTNILIKCFSFIYRKVNNGYTISYYDNRGDIYEMFLSSVNLKFLQVNYG